MNKPIDKFLKTICCLLIAICLLAAGSISIVSAQEERTAGMTVEGTFTMFGRVCTLEYDYDDNLFLAPPDQYDHEMARLSLGLALAAGRHMDHPDAQDDYLIDFLQKLGFSQLETDTYRTNPTIDSIAYGLAVKKIGDVTILACAVCGGDYGLEWASNLTVGDSVRSAGFEDASLKVQAAIKEYLKKNPSQAGSGFGPQATAGQERYLILQRRILRMPAYLKRYTPIPLQLLVPPGSRAPIRIFSISCRKRMWSRKFLLLTGDINGTVRICSWFPRKRILTVEKSWIRQRSCIGK